MNDAIEKGRQAWRDGADHPGMPGDDASDDERMFYIGLVYECARDYFARRKIALYPDLIEPRP